MADRPEGIVLRRHRDLEGRSLEPWTRRGLLLLLAVVPVLALANVFGQAPETKSVTAPAARLQLSAPTSLRGGLLFQARFTVEARRELKKAQLVLSPGWLDGFTLNTVEPSPIGEGSEDGRIVLTLGHVPAGTRYVLFLQFQVNPTNVGRHDQDAALLDGSRQLAVLHRTVTVFP